MVKIIVADDEGYIREGIVWILKTKGYNILEAQNGEECLALLSKDKVDLVILDLKMPKRDGWHTAKEIRKTPGYESIPILVYSGHIYDKNDAQDVELKEKVTEILTKPLDISNLIKLVGKYVQEH